MLVFPSWRPERAAMATAAAACARPRWVPEPRFASYLAPAPHAPRHPLSLHMQIEDEHSSSSCPSSPERAACGEGGDEGEAAGESEWERACEWRGCTARARGTAALSAHVAREHAHAHADGLFYCGWRACSRPHRGFNARYKMLVHVRTHTNEKPHACALCLKRFSRAENLKIHLRSHSGEKPYVCPYEGCNKAYSNSSDRFKHTRMHAEDKPYCCKVSGCGKRYTDPSSLRKHVKTYKHFAPPTPAPAAPAADRLRPPTSITDGPTFDAVRVPAYDMSYIEYSRIYSGYSTSPSEEIYHKQYDVLLRNDDLIYNDRVFYGDGALPEGNPSVVYQRRVVGQEPEGPLDLKCSGEGTGSGRVRVHSIEDSMEFQLVRAMEMPLDLSNKS